MGFAAFPEIIAVLIIAAGVLLAYAVRRLLLHAAPWLNRVAARSNMARGPLLSTGFTRVAAGTAFWGILVASLVLGFAFLGSGERGLLLATVSQWLWRILVALGIVLAGHVIGLMLRDVLRGLVRKAEFSALPQMAYLLVIGIAIVTALEHLGLNISFLTQVALVFVSVFLIGLALAFALGARTLVSNLAAQSELQRYRPGDRIVVDGLEGTVLEIDRTGMVVSTANGQARIPGARFAELTVVLLRETADEPDSEGEPDKNEDRDDG